MTEAQRGSVVIMCVEAHGPAAAPIREAQLASAAGPIAAHGGRAFKANDTSRMAEFADAAAAVRCAVEIQATLDRDADGAPSATLARVRIGLHSGEVLRKDEDVIGDTVNIAAWVALKARPGCTLITRAVRDQLPDRSERVLAPAGSLELNKVDGPLELFELRSASRRGVVPATEAMGHATRLSMIWAELIERHVIRWTLAFAAGAWIALQVIGQLAQIFDWSSSVPRAAALVLLWGVPIVAVAAWFHGCPGRQAMRPREAALILFCIIGAVVSALRTPSAHAPPHADAQIVEPVVLVLPFDRIDQSIDATFVAGLHEEIIESLTKAGGFGVQSRTTALASNAATSSITEVVRGAGATHVVEGSLRRDGGMLALTAQLIVSGGDRHVFSLTQRYPAGAIASKVQRDFATQVAGRTRFMLHPVDWISPGFPTTDDAVAFEMFKESEMEARYGDDRTAAGLLTGALARDPDFAQAHAALALVAMRLTPRDEALICEHVLAVERLQPDLPEGALAYGRDCIDLCAAVGAISVLRSLQCAWARFYLYTPGLPRIGYYHRVVGWHYDDETDQRRYATALRHNVWYHLAMVPYLRWDQGVDASIASLDRAFTEDPYLLEAGVRAATQRIQLGRLAEAQRIVDQLLSARPLAMPLQLLSARIEFQKSGDLEPLHHLVASIPTDELDADDAEQILATRIAYALLRGELDEAIALVERNHIERLTYGPAVTDRHTICQPFLRSELLAVRGRWAEARSLALAGFDGMKHGRRTGCEGATYYTFELFAAYLKVFSGDTTSARKYLESYLNVLYLGNRNKDKGTSERPVLHADAAAIFAWLGDADRAIDELTKSLEESNGSNAQVLARDAMFSPLYDDPRLERLLASHGARLVRHAQAVGWRTYPGRKAKAAK